MEGGNDPKHPTRNRMNAWFKRKVGASHTHPQALSISGLSAVAESADRRRALTRYAEAAKLLEDAVKGRKDQRGSLAITKLSGEFEKMDDSQFKNMLDSVLEANEYAVEDRTALAKCKYAIRCCFTAFSPFAKTFLSIAAQGSAVHSFQILSSLILHRYQC
jgi:hypothetical protein